MSCLVASIVYEKYIFFVWKLFPSKSVLDCGFLKQRFGRNAEWIQQHNNFYAAVLISGDLVAESFP